jgi:hypothetical protein
MKAILEFNLPEDNYEYKKAVNADKYFTALEDIYQLLRTKVKYAEKTEAEDKVYNEVYDDFYRILNDYNINLFE